MRFLHKSILMTLLVFTGLIKNGFSAENQINIGDNTIQGYISNTTETPISIEEYVYDKYLQIDSPIYLTNAADSYFMLKGEILNSSYPDVVYTYQNLTKNTDLKWGSLENELEFEEPVYLKEGPGLYEIQIMVGLERRNSFYHAATLYVTNVAEADYSYLMHSDELFFSGFSDYVDADQLSREPTTEAFVLWGEHYIGGYLSNLSPQSPLLQTLYPNNLVILEPSYLSNMADGFFHFRGINLTNEYRQVALRTENLSKEEEPHWIYITNEGYFERDVFFTQGFGIYKFTAMLGPVYSGTWYEAVTFYVTNTSDVDFRHIATTVDAIKNKYDDYISKDQFVREAYNVPEQWNGIQLDGYISNIGKSAMITETLYYSNVVILNPGYLTNVADNFFVLRGIQFTNHLDKLGVQIENVDNNYESKFNYILITNGGYFEKKVYLGAGEGLSVVNIMGAELASDSYYNLGHFFVYNQPSTNLTFLLPSDNVQSDSPVIIELSEEITAGIVNRQEKVRAIHDWVVSHLDYDFESYRYPAARKRQDALSVLQNEMAVCEGYSALFAALLRAQNIPTKILAGTANNRYGWQNHAWNAVLWDGEWHYIDVTWDDPTGYSFLMGEDDPAANLSYDYYDVEESEFNRNHRETTVLIY